RARGLVHESSRVRPTAHSPGRARHGRKIATPSPPGCERSAESRSRRCRQGSLRGSGISSPPVPAIPTGNPPDPRLRGSIGRAAPGELRSLTMRGAWVSRGLGVLLFAGACNVAEALAAGEDDAAEAGSAVTTADTERFVGSYR